VRNHQSEWPRDSSEAGLSQCQEWHQYRLGRLHEEKELGWLPFLWQTEKVATSIAEVLTE